MGRRGIKAIVLVSLSSNIAVLVVRISQLHVQDDSSVNVRNYLFSTNCDTILDTCRLSFAFRVALTLTFLKCEMY